MALIIFSLLTIPYWQRRKTNQLYTQFKMVMIDGRNTKIEIGCGTLHCCLMAKTQVRDSYCSKMAHLPLGWDSSQQIPIYTQHNNSYRPLAFNVLHNALHL
jgi:hypothetical protein